MGWKAVKDHYRIGHHVQVNEKGICIGSGYIHDIIVVSLAGEIVKPYGRESNEDLARYEAEMRADPAKLRALVAQADVFGDTMPVYTFDGARIIEKRCEVFGYPHATTDGDCMYENRFFRTRDEAIRAALQSAHSGVAGWGQAVEEARRRLADVESHFVQVKGELEALTAQFPEAAAEVAASRAADVDPED
ncbi:hypothetical protein KTD31_02950 [Burkholderia multivorans]|uniref:hypothetical protein n=1 Tax=Burkholderia multivorans TaxID=87883 RepID=UPI001C23916A|nr:hypothetical protein [Burkholderia multivorans]MBU9200310.1 hypothetical protein [Burkholderia multivorans]MDN8078564.1 hypothetical protein [Burkholderia multivorans]